jgi:hypothetical protein
MKVNKRDVYLTEFEGFTFKQRFYYVWANEISVSDFNLNSNPLKWCLMDLIKIIYIPILFVVIFPLLIIPVSFYMATKLKSKYENEEDHGWFKSAQWIIE